MFERREQVGKMLCGMGKIQETHGISSMDIKKGLQPIGSIADRADLCRLHDLAPSHLHFRQVRKGLGGG